MSGMSESVGASGGKRRRAGSGVPPLSDSEQLILDLILSKGSEGILLRGVKYESKLPDRVVTNALKSLVAKSLIKEVKSIKSQGRKVFMGIECMASKEVSGGIWYVEGKLDTELIHVLKRFCFMRINKHTVDTLEEIHKAVQQSGLMNIEVPLAQVAELLTAMVLDDEIMEVKSTGLGDYYGLPVGKMCYRVASGGGKSLVAGAFAWIPCGMCPRIGVCTPGGTTPQRLVCITTSGWMSKSKPIVLEIFLLFASEDCGSVIDIIFQW